MAASCEHPLAGGMKTAKNADEDTKARTRNLVKYKSAVMPQFLGSVNCLVFQTERNKARSTGGYQIFPADPTAKVPLYNFTRGQEHNQTINSQEIQ
jgi:hypothetical protein